LFLRPWPGIYAATATVKAPAVVIINYHRTVDISIVDNGPVYVYHRGIVAKLVAFPPATAIAITAIAVTIVNAAVKTNMRAPITNVKSVESAGITPVSGCPVQTGIWRGNPHAWYPVVTIFIIVISPIAWLPYITIGRAFGLHINR